MNKGTQFFKKFKFSKMKFLSSFLLLIVVSLIIFSCIGLYLIHSRLSSHGINMSSQGVEFYISELGSYKSLFIATVSVIAAYLGLKRLEAATDANEDKLRNDRFNEWKTVLESRIQEQSLFDPYMKRGFITIRYQLFQTIYGLNFNIKSMDDLKKVFSHFDKLNGNLPSFFENLNNKFLDMGGIYPNEDYSYSFDSFRYIIYGCINEAYKGFENDLVTLYIAKLPETRLIDLTMYRSALESYKLTVRAVI